MSIGDPVNWVMTVQDETIHHLEDYITGRDPGSRLLKDPAP